jgi:peroxiredoxin
MSAIEIGQRAPSFRLPAAQGGEVGVDDYRGRTNLILFFAKGMGCGFCRQKMSQLARGAPRFRSLDTEIVMVTPTPLSRAQFYARNFQLPFPYLCDPDYAVHETYGLAMRPHSLAWKTKFLLHAARIPQPENDFGPAKPTLPELVRVLNDDDLGFFIVDKEGIVRATTRGPYTLVEGAKPVGMQPIPSNDEIVADLEGCQRTNGARASA